MSKNRRIPFGYMMQNGIITTNPAEVLAVLTIFSEYMSGKSLESIAINMKVPYSEDKIWNKNMVKRVLENEKYLGMDVYPQLISEEVFKAVNERKSAKATSLCIVPDELQEVRSLTVCKKCGKRLFRTKAELWDCRNHECRPFLFKMADEMLTGAILNILNTVIANPTLIEAEATVSDYIPTSEIRCKQSEIDRAIDNGTKTAEEIRNDILRLAELKYKHCTYSDVNQKTELLKPLIDNSDQLNTLDIGLLSSCVKRITVSHSCVIEAEFINGVIIKNETERSDDNGSGSKCKDNSCQATSS
ncbi:recombinase family protein [Ruminococcus sp.]|uniref:recombinase family protein n=1 Tax=Ruminococcus sp. TaxID=41978 RepID=UPI0025E7375D|nr:recombinase family protein [Ruminococcus sp.]